MDSVITSGRVWRLNDKGLFLLALSAVANYLNVGEF